jgi:transglutaminase-like putative cysteine protease
MRITIEHKTRYHYAGEASYSIQNLRLTPSIFDGQQVLAWQVACRPEARLLEARDGFGNTTHLVIVNGGHQAIEITAAGSVEIEDRHGVVRGLAEAVPLRVFLRRTALTEPGDAIAALVDAVPRADTVPWLHALMTAIRERVDYLAGVTGAQTTAIEALTTGKGVCQDHAHIFIAAARLAGIPTRYVTGYLIAEGDGPSVAHHAWAEAWVEGLGWVGFDVANRICPTDHHVRLAAALDARHAAPIRGSRRGGGGETLEVEVRVQQSAGQQ